MLYAICNKEIKESLTILLAILSWLSSRGEYSCTQQRTLLVEKNGRRKHTKHTHTQYPKRKKYNKRVKYTAHGNLVGCFEENKKSSTNHAVLSQKAGDRNVNLKCFLRTFPGRVRGGVAIVQDWFSRLPALER